jgi:hypothetical protein
LRLPLMRKYHRPLNHVILNSTNLIEYIELIVNRLIHINYDVVKGHGARYTLTVCWLMDARDTLTGTWLMGDGACLPGYG